MALSAYTVTTYFYSKLVSLTVHEMRRFLNERCTSSLTREKHKDSRGIHQPHDSHEGQYVVHRKVGLETSRVLTRKQPPRTVSHHFVIRSLSKRKHQKRGPLYSKVTHVARFLGFGAPRGLCKTELLLEEIMSCTDYFLEGREIATGQAKRRESTDYGYEDEELPREL